MKLDDNERFFLLKLLLNFTIMQDTYRAIPSSSGASEFVDEDFRIAEIVKLKLQFYMHAMSYDGKLEALGKAVKDLRHYINIED